MLLSIFIYFNFYNIYLLYFLFFTLSIKFLWIFSEVFSEILKFKKTLYTPYVDELEIKAYEEYQKNLLHEELSEKNETKEN